MFQSSPGHATGRDARIARVLEGMYRFQSSPGHATGRDRFSRKHDADTVIVSILTRPRDRARQAAEAANLKAESAFQSSPGHATGRDIVGLTAVTVAIVFQSSPGHATGRDKELPMSWRPDGTGFNPHPATRPGATAFVDVSASEVLVVSILTRPRDRARLPVPAGSRAVPD